MGFAVGIGRRQWDDITLGDGEGQGEHAPSRLICADTGSRRSRDEDRQIRVFCATEAAMTASPNADHGLPG